MTSKMTITIEIAQEDGSVIKNTRTEEIPGLADFELNGFRDSFDTIEAALLETRKEISDTTIEDYLSDISKKKLIYNNKQCRAM